MYFTGCLLLTDGGPEKQAGCCRSSIPCSLQDDPSDRTYRRIVFQLSYRSTQQDQSLNTTTCIKWMSTMEHIWNGFFPESLTTSTTDPMFR